MHVFQRHVCFSSRIIFTRDINREASNYTHVVFYLKLKRHRVSITCHESTEWDQRSNSTLSLTPVLDTVGWSTTRSVPFTSGKETRYTFYRRLGGPQGQSGLVRKISHLPTGFDPRPILTVESLCTGLIIQDHVMHYDTFERNFQFRTVEHILH